MTKDFLELLNKAIDDALNHAHYSALHPDIEKPIEHNEWKNQWMIKNLPQHCSINTSVGGKRPIDESLNAAAYEHAVKHSSAPDKETPDWIIADFKAGALWALSQSASANAEAGEGKE